MHQNPIVIVEVVHNDYFDLSENVINLINLPEKLSLLELKSNIMIKATVLTRVPTSCIVHELRRFVLVLNSVFGFGCNDLGEPFYWLVLLALTSTKGIQQTDSMKSCHRSAPIRAVGNSVSFLMLY